MVLRTNWMTAYKTGMMVLVITFMALWTTASIGGGFLQSDKAVPSHDGLPSFRLADAFFMTRGVDNCTGAVKWTRKAAGELKTQAQSEPAEAVKEGNTQARFEKADTVVIDNNGQLTAVGQLEMAMGQGGQVTGRTYANPAGPIIVYVFRSINENYKNEIDQVDFKVTPHEGGAYLFRKDNPNDLRHLRDVDPKLDPLQIASEFGVSLK
jgi:hypothetical protein